jgi:hypothetical protein
MDCGSRASFEDMQVLRQAVKALMPTFLRGSDEGKRGVFVVADPREWIHDEHEAHLCFSVDALVRTAVDSQRGCVAS